MVDATGEQRVPILPPHRADGIATLDELVAVHRCLEDRLERYVKSDIAARVHDAYPVPLFTTLSDYVLRPSKHFVGLLYLVTLRALQPSVQITAEPFLSVATALELRHAAILIHDDVVDGDRTRGSIATAPVVLETIYGDEAMHAAIFAGEALSAMTVSPIVRCGLEPRISLALIDLMLRYTCQTAVGQAWQLHLDTQRPLDSVSIEDIIDVHVSHMASTTVECSMQMAIATLSDEIAPVPYIADYAALMAAAFQAQNDLAGYRELLRTARGEGANIPLANVSDIERRRRTILLRHALDLLGNDDRRALLAFLSGDETVSMASVLAVVENSGAAEAAEWTINTLFARAQKVLHGVVTTPGDTASRLLAVHQFMVDLYDPESPISGIHLLSRPDLVQPV